MFCRKNCRRLDKGLISDAKYSIGEKLKMAKFDEKSKIGITGHVLITDADSGDIILDKYNAINSENLAAIIATLLSNGNTNSISNMDYGVGGTVIDSVGNIEYKVPRVDGEATTGLYEYAYTKDVSGADPENSIDVVLHNGYPYSDVVITSTLGYIEPTGQLTEDNADYVDGDFIFDEIALKTGTGKYLTHLIFHPIQKSANRKIQIVYTLRIRVGSE